MSPCVDLSRVKKLELIRDSKDSLSQSHLAAKYHVSTGAVCNILKGNQEYWDDFKSNQSNDVQRKITNNLRRKTDDETYL